MGESRALDRQGGPGPGPGKLPPVRGLGGGGAFLPGPVEARSVGEVQGSAAVPSTRKHAPYLHRPSKDTPPRHRSRGRGGLQTRAGSGSR